MAIMTIETISKINALFEAAEAEDAGFEPSFQDWAEVRILFPDPEWAVETVETVGACKD